MKDLNERVVQILLNVNADVSEHIDDSDLVTNGFLDSLDIMRLIVGLEREFEIEIEPEQTMSENFESVAAMVSLVEVCLSKHKA